jgi:hypothetical protein
MSKHNLVQVEAVGEFVEVRCYMDDEMKYKCEFTREQALALASALREAAEGSVGKGKAQIQNLSSGTAKGEP